MILLLELILVLGIIVALLVILIAFRTRKGRGALDRHYFKTEWAKVLKTVPTGEQGWRLAIIDADKLVDHALKQHGAKGESMGDRLRDRQRIFSHYNNLWSAHKMRNRLVHEPGVKLTKQLTSKVLKEFQMALKELGAL
jgi:hypothetical protein